MAADLHVHVLTHATTEKEVRYFNLPLHSMGDERYHDAYTHITATPNIWIGEVSWLKAALFEDGETFIPDTVRAVQDIIGHDLTELTEEMLERLLAAFGKENKTDYALTQREKVEQFLRPYLGKNVFTVSW